MTSVGLDLFIWKGGEHLVMVDHFSGIPFYSRMTKTKAEAVTKQLATWFNMDGACKFVRADRGPPFFLSCLRGFLQVVVHQPQSDSVILPNQLRGRRESHWGPERASEEGGHKEVLL